jgi:hypothetical protein
MRGLFSLLLVPALSLSVLALPSPALAQDAPSTPTDQVAPAGQDAPAAPKSHTRLKWEERFVLANTAHDGHLTLEEAKAGYPTIAKHFQSIDVDGKGYVTENDIRAWHALRRVAAHLSRQPDDELRPRNAYQRTYPDTQKPLNTNTSTQLSSGQVSSGQVSSGQ